MPDESEYSNWAALMLKSFSMMRLKSLNKIASGSVRLVASNAATKVKMAFSSVEISSTTVE